MPPAAAQLGEFFAEYGDVLDGLDSLEHALQTLSGAGDFWTPLIAFKVLRQISNKDYT